MTYCSLSDMALPETVEVMEELLNSYLALEHLGLHALLNVELNVQSASRLADAKPVEVGCIALGDTCSILEVFSYGSWWS